MGTVIDGELSFTQKNKSFQIMEQVYSSILSEINNNINQHPIDILEGICKGVDSALSQYVTEVLSEKDRERFISVFKEFIDKHSFSLVGKDYE